MTTPESRWPLGNSLIIWIIIFIAVHLVFRCDEDLGKMATAMVLG